jgi:hypothetical protein
VFQAADEEAASKKAAEETAKKAAAADKAAGTDTAQPCFCECAFNVVACSAEAERRRVEEAKLLEEAASELDEDATDDDFAAAFLSAKSKSPQPSRRAGGAQAPVAPGKPAGAKQAPAKTPVKYLFDL